MTTPTTPDRQDAQREPVAWIINGRLSDEYYRTSELDVIIPLYARQAKLTDEQIQDIATPFLQAKFEINSSTPRFDIHAFARAIERAHGIGESK